MLIHFDQQKAAWFESDFCVSSATLMTIWTMALQNLISSLEHKRKLTDFVCTRAVMISDFHYVHHGMNNSR